MDKISESIKNPPNPLYKGGKLNPEIKLVLNSFQDSGWQFLD